MSTYLPENVCLTQSSILTDGTEGKVSLGHQIFAS